MTADAPRRPVVSHAGEEPAEQGRGLLAGSEATGGRYALFHFVVPPGDDGPPRHLHEREDEAFYVISGALVVEVDGETVEAGPGSFVNLPSGVPHSYANPGDAPAEVLVFCAPGGFEAFYAGYLALISEAGEPEEIRALAARYGIRFV